MCLPTAQSVGSRRQAVVAMPRLACCWTVLMVVAGAGAGPLPPVVTVAGIPAAAAALPPPTRPPPPSGAAPLSLTLSRTALADLAAPAPLVAILPPVDPSSLYYNFTLSVSNAPGGHVSAALDANLRNLGRTMFLSMGVMPTGDFQLVHVWNRPNSNGSRDGTPIFDLLYYFAMPKNTFPHIVHFSSYCGWTATHSEGGGGQTHGGHDGGHGVGHGPVGHPSTSGESPLNRALRTLPDMGAVSVGMSQPVRLESRIGPEGARIDHVKGDIEPGPPQRAGGSSGGRTKVPALAVGLAVAAAGGLIVCGLIAYAAHKRRQGAEEGGGVFDSGVESPGREAQVETGGMEGRRRDGGEARGEGRWGVSDTRSWSDGGWSEPSFSLEHPDSRQGTWPAEGGRAGL